MAMPAREHDVWTPERVRELPDDGNRYELIAGELLVTPAPKPPHQRIAARLFVALHQYVAAQNLGETLWSPADISLDDESIVQPDIFLVPRAIANAGFEWADVTSLVLVIEILSPSTARRDRGIKRDFFQRHRVPEYWIVDPDSQLIERWRPEASAPEIMRDALTWFPEGAASGLKVDLSTIFFDSPAL